MSNCNKFNKIFVFSKQVSLALSECSDLSDKAKFSVLQSAIAPTDGESAGKLTSSVCSVTCSCIKSV